MRAMSIAAIATGLIATAPMSAAADQTITESFSLTIFQTVVPDSNQALLQFDSTLFPQFAPTSGTLESVNVTLSGPVEVVSFAANPGIFLETQELSVNNPFELPPGTTNMTTNINLSFSGTPENEAFIGTGETEFSLFEGSTAPTPNASVAASLSGAITYTFTPPTLTLAVPETPTWAAMLIGFGCLGLAAYGATRKTSVTA